MNKKELRQSIRVAKSQQDSATLAMWSEEISKKILSRLSSLNSRLSSLNSRLSSLNSRLSSLNSRLSSLDSRLSTLDSRLSPILLYSPLPDEVDIRPVIEALYAKGINILLPKVTGDTTMELRLYEGPESLQSGAFGIQEPIGKSIPLSSLVSRLSSNPSRLISIIPGMAFDKAGHRLGRGKGYYDRFLSSIETYKIGVCYPFQMLDTIPHDAHDILMDEVITADTRIEN